MIITADDGQGEGERAEVVAHALKRKAWQKKSDTRRSVSLDARAREFGFRRKSAMLTAIIRGTHKVVEK